MSITITTGGLPKFIEQQYSLTLEIVSLKKKGPQDLPKPRVYVNIK